MGFFGFTLKRGPDGKATPQRRHLAVVDLVSAMHQVRDIIQVWQEVVGWPGLPPFSGGVYDAWPARAAQGLVICRQEFAMAEAYASQELARG